MATGNADHEDERVAAILEDPHRYFAAATARARVLASAEVEVELADRARHRRHGWATRPRSPRWPATG